MKRQNKIDKSSGSGDIGVPSPKIASGMDPRPPTQRNTGMNITRHIRTIMEDAQKYIKGTDTGGVGTPRSGVEGLIKQGPSTSSSGHCGLEHLPSRDETATKSNGKETNNEQMDVKEQKAYAFISASDGENTSEWLLFPTPKRMGRIKRDRQSSSEEAVGKNPKKKIAGKTDHDAEEIDSLEDYVNGPEIEHLPPSKSARRLPSTTELAKGMREMTTADMVALIIHRTKASEKIVAKSKNLKGNLKKYM